MCVFLSLIKSQAALRSSSPENLDPHFINVRTVVTIATNDIRRHQYIEMIQHQLPAKHTKHRYTKLRFEKQYTVKY